MKKPDVNPHNVIEIYQIYYVAALEPQSLMDVTPFQGFSTSNMAAIEFYRKVLSLPQNVLELKEPISDVAMSRALGITSINIIPIDAPWLTDAIAEIPSFFTVLYSSSKTHSAVREAISRSSHPVLHISEVKDKGCYTVENLDKDLISKYVKKVIWGIKDAQVKKLMLKDVGDAHWSTSNIDFIDLRQHLVTVPNQLTLDAYHLKYNVGKPLIDAKEKEYVDAISLSAKRVLQFQRQVCSKKRNAAKVGLIVCVPGVYKHQLNKKWNKEVLQLDQGRRFIRAHQVFTKQAGYTLPRWAYDNTIPELVQYIAGIRRGEFELLTIALSIKAVSTVAPVLRLPPAVGMLRPLLKDFGACVRAKNKPNRTFKMNKLFKKVQKHFEETVDGAFIDLIKASDQHVKIIADIPLEWLPVDGVPLMLHKDVSRIPITPGNLFFAKAIENTRRIIPPDKLRKVLILRSFGAGDGIRHFLTHATTVFGNISQRFKFQYQYVDISTETDLVNALNDFDGAILVYDGHGEHDKGTDTGGLVIGGKTVNILSLKDKIKCIPPIVILSACDTHPVDASHATTANSFLILGAITVLATLVPVNALDSGIYFGRLLYRLEEYLPLYMKIFSPAVRWNHLVSGLQRMMYITDIMKRVIKVIDPSFDKKYHAVGLVCNQAINSERVDWFDVCITSIAESININVDELKSRLFDNGFFCETLRYIQLGNPENLVITFNPEDPKDYTYIFDHVQE